MVAGKRVAPAVGKLHKMADVVIYVYIIYVFMCVCVCKICI